MAQHEIIEDPDLAQAIEDLRPVFAELRQAKRDMRKLNGTMTSVGYQAAAALAADRRSIITTRAQRLAIDPDALSVILAAEAGIRMRVKRAPSRRQMEKALMEECTYQATRRSDAEAALRQAQGEYAAAIRSDIAAKAARLAYTGFGS